MTSQIKSLSIHVTQVEHVDVDTSGSSEPTLLEINKYIYIYMNMRQTRRCGMLAMSLPFSPGLQRFPWHFWCKSKITSFAMSWSDGEEPFLSP